MVRRPKHATYHGCLGRYEEYLAWEFPRIYIFLGFALNGTTVPESDLGPYVQEAIDQVGSSFLPSSSNINYIVPDKLCDW